MLQSSFDENHFKIFSKSLESTMKLGHILADRIREGDIIGLFGDLGAGKTSLIKGICYALGVSKEVYITSPTFVILNIYEGRLPIYHFDLYRINTKEELIDLGYEEYLFSKGVCLIEWAERATGLLPENYLRIYMESISPTERGIEISLYGNDYKERFSDIEQYNINRHYYEGAK